MRWAVTHPDYYLSMFGTETVKRDHPGLLVAGGRAFGNLVDAIAGCLDSGVLQDRDPLAIAGPMWSLVHGVAVAIGGDLCDVGIDEDPEALVLRAITEFLAGAEPG